MDRIGLFAIIVVLWGCSGSPGGTGSSSSGGAGTAAAPSRAAPVHYNPVLTAPVAPAHARYLADALTFVPLNDGGVQAPKTAVVGSRVARFYPISILRTLKKAASSKVTTDDIPRDKGTGWYSKDWTMDELKSLPNGDPIPFGTILPLSGGENGEVSGPLYNLFGFQGNFNKFYKTTFGGKDGFVFGADLYGLQQTPLQNQIASELYLTAGKPQVFHAVTGLGALSSPVAEKLSQDRLAFQSTTLQRDYSLGPTNPDDLVSCYLQLVPRGGHNYQSIFLTTDLAAHAQHLVFDRVLQHIEETQLEPRLKTLVEGLVDAVQEWQKDHASADPWPANLALRYLQVAEGCLDLAPEVTTEADEYRREQTVYKDVDAATVLADYPEPVRHDLKLMDQAEGFLVSDVLTKDPGAVYREDFSQYKPRGHYTKNGVLKAYFRAMMWFGRINFLIAKSGDKPLASPGGTSGDSEALTLAMEPTALLFADLISKDQDLYTKWANLFDPITTLIGLSDDLSFEEVVPLWKDQNVADVAAWTASRKNLLHFMELAHQKLRAPAISGNSVLWGPSEGTDRAPPMGWRLFGQRFTWDSYVHEQVSPPRLRSRDMVRGLDVMKAFGSRTADRLLAISDYPKMEGLEARLNDVAKIFSGWSGDDWNKTFYNQTLFTIRAQALFEPGVGFFFTESPAWGLKAMVASHGTWAELRHDTLLYVKQVYAERAGDGDFDPTFRTEEVPRPVHYIEPNLPFWQGVNEAVEGLRATLERYNMTDEEGETALSGLAKLYQHAVSIVQDEIADKPVSREDLDWIPTFPRELAPVVMVYNRSDVVANPDQLRMAEIADVYTNAELGLVLEVGVGTPLRLFVPLNDGQGGKRIAVGFTYSYYEFGQPLGNRLTDEAWKEQVYPDSSRVTDKLPFWAKGLALPAQ